MLCGPIGLLLIPVSMVILLKHAAGAVVRYAQRGGAFVVVVAVKRVAGHSLKTAQGVIRVRLCWHREHTLLDKMRITQLSTPQAMQPGTKKKKA